MKKNSVNTNTNQFDFPAAEQRWRARWQDMDLYRTGDDPQRPNMYILDYFPYPSGAGLSVGHCRNYVPTCVSARFHRMRGFNVLHPMGWDAFGLPAENYAIKHGIHPRESSAAFSATYRRQMKLIACSYDWSREFSSTDPEFYRWTQWFFLLLYHRNLAYRALSSQWWCPVDQTILANEQVINGRCWRCGAEVVKKDLEQWHFRITEYAERLLDDLQLIEWPEAIKTMQRNWIGRSEGVEIIFDWGKQSGDPPLSVFTTRADTLYGVTYLALAPEHPLAKTIATEEYTRRVQRFIAGASSQSDRQRAAGVQEMSGEFTGRYVIHPLTGGRIPVWIAGYVLPGYGTGAIMAVPAHDGRDHAFARQHELPVVPVVSAPEAEGAEYYEGPGVLVESGPYSGLQSAAGAERITADLEAAGVAVRRVNFKMRDWLISRQRYWGAPIPIIHCADCGAVPVPEMDLPVLLPDIVDFAPSGDGRSPLARADAWVNTTCPSCDGPARRETDTMDGFACSSWYFLRFASPHYEHGPFDPQAVRAWLPVDAYVGGAEHAIMHLLYSRFWTKVMYDAGLVNFVEPFTRLMNQGVMHSAVDGQRMSKSRGNVVTPDEVVAAHGTDALRVYILFLGPFEADAIWDSRGIRGVTRFLDRYWRMAAEPMDMLTESGKFDAGFERRRHQIIESVTADYEKYRFNTAVASLMSYLNHLLELREQGVNQSQWRSAVETMTLLLCPMAPFVTEEVWCNILGHTESVHSQDWPVYDPALAAQPMDTIVLQINGRVRDRVQVPAGAGEDDLRAAALASTAVGEHLRGKEIRRLVIVPGQLVNIVV